MRMGFPVVLFFLSAHSPASEIALSHCRTWTIPERSSLLHSAWALWSLGYCTAINQQSKPSLLAAKHFLEWHPVQTVSGMTLFNFMNPLEVKIASAAHL